MFKKYRGRERWFADHRILKSAPVWYQPHFHLTIESEYTKESILADADTWETSFTSMMNSYHGSGLARYFYCIG
uniref:Uncharacterized protein n=1 Tax=Romanomermis culicivorax TaxID=13658 RepID=A0A915J8C7_ROMCU